MFEFQRSFIFDSFFKGLIIKFSIFQKVCIYTPKLGYNFSCSLLMMRSDL
jgi:hypothetical protein